MSVFDVYEVFLNVLVLQNLGGFQIELGRQAIELFQVPRMQS